MPTYRDLAYTDEHINVEENEYIDCSFTRCHFHYPGGAVRMGNCLVISPILELADNALATVQFLQSLGYQIQHSAGVSYFESTDQEDRS